VSDNVLLVTIDSLSRHFLDVYGGDVEFDVATPNLDRFADTALTFDTHYAGSLPCMPARREWFTGTQEFLWRPWGPIEPFDTPLARAANEAGVVTGLVTDHYHYFEHGSDGYYKDFGAYEFVRGHEYDPYRRHPKAPDQRLLSQIGATDADTTVGRARATYARNAATFDELDETDFFAPRVFRRTADWIREHEEWDRWFCVLDSFDVHEPFHCPEPYASMYTDEDPTDLDLVNWPYYGRVDEGQSALTDRQLNFVRAQFAGKVTMVDRWFGRVLDALERTNQWEETTVILTADHGHYLGEHGFVGKPQAPLYDVLAQTPLLIWDPNSPRMGERTEQLTAAVDLYATVLDALDIPEDVVDRRHSRSVTPILDGEFSTAEHREWALYGYWGSGIAVTDGRYTYHHPCDETVDAVCHSTRMINANAWFQPETPEPDAKSGAFLPYTDTPVWRYTVPAHSRHDEPLCFDTADDTGQTHNIAPDTSEITRLRALLKDALGHLDAPPNVYNRLQLSPPETQ
jgi:arylsulfatase A-like enzyme